MIDTKTGNLKTLNPKEGDVLICVESPHHWWTVGSRYVVTSDGTPQDDEGMVYGDFFNPQPSVVFTYTNPVPIGYTGKLKDMDLQEGDVVRHTKGRNDLYTFNNGYVGRVTIENSNDDYTLISRASETWSDWHMSRKDGSYDTHPNREYDVNPLPDTDQVTYRWRDIAGKEPVEEWVDATASTAYYENEFMQVKTIDGKPDWSTIRYVPF